MNILFFALLPSFALATPAIPVPEDALRQQWICASTEVRKNWSGDQWTPWQTFQESETVTRSLWKGSDGNQRMLEERAGRITFTRIEETLSEGSLLERTEHVEEWRQNAGRWEKTDFQKFVTFVNRSDGSQRRIERKDGNPTLYWDVTFTSSREGTTEAKALKNPSALSSEHRKVGGLQILCAH